jgi:hypothetical protein
MIEFKINPHLIKPNQQMVEVWSDGALVATIYPSSGENVRGEPRLAIAVVSKCFEDYCYYTDGEDPAKITLLLDIKQ